MATGLCMGGILAILLPQTLSSSPPPTNTGAFSVPPFKLATGYCYNVIAICVWFSEFPTFILLKVNLQPTEKGVSLG